MESTVYYSRIGDRDLTPPLENCEEWPYKTETNLTEAVEWLRKVEANTTPSLSTT